MNAGRERAAANRVTASIRLGKRRRATVSVEATPGGLLAIGGMVGLVLLSTSVVVRGAIRAPRAPLPGGPPRLAAPADG